MEEREILSSKLISSINLQQMNFRFIQRNSHAILHYYPHIMVSLLTSIFRFLLSIIKCFPFFFHFTDDS